MREIKRSIAKDHMRAQGVTRLFKRLDGRHSSKFARHWREYIGDTQRVRAGRKS